jgi:CheY-like chemotaxis protein
MPHTLLLADDSVTIQRVIELTFADEGIAVTAVSDGDEAMRRILADRPDIILADVDLPIRDGYEIAALVKRDEELQRTPVLLLTGAFEPIDQERAREAGCDGILSKPFDPQVLIAHVRELLGEQEPRLIGPDALGEWPSDDALVQEGDRAPGEMPLDLSSVAFERDAPAGPETSLDDYFDRLDAAFANLTGAPPAHDAAGVGPQGPGVAGRSGAGSAAAGAAVSDAFARLLDAEQTFGPGSAQAAESLETQPAAPVVDEAFLDDLARRVAERIGGAALREAVAGIVSATAERLVREEIERIKDAAK